MIPFIPYLRMDITQHNTLYMNIRRNTRHPAKRSEKSCGQGRKIRTAWDEEKEEWYFSVVDVIAVLTDQPTARNASTYWAVLKKRLKEEGASELLTNCKQLKMRATDGKMRLTDVASTEQILRIIQSIPSPKAEPFKRWLAQVGRERIEETNDPEQAIEADTGRPAVTAQNAAQLNAVVTDVIQGVAEADKPNEDEK